MAYYLCMSILKANSKFRKMRIDFSKQLRIGAKFYSKENK